MYTTQGTIVAAAYTATCCECKTTFHHSSWIPKSDDKQEYFFDPIRSNYVQTTSHTVFERKLLDHLTFQIVFSGATFESQAQVYNAMHGALDETRLTAFINTFGKVNNTASLTWKLNEKRLEDGWFLYQLIMFYKNEAGTLNSADVGTTLNRGNRRDIEQLCEVANLQLSIRSPKWVAHSCGIKGCREGFAVVDGNEKINRPVCAAPKSRVKIPQQHIFMTNMCTRSPVNGGKHQSPSKYCTLHSELTSEEDIESPHPMPTPHTTDSLLQKSQVGELPDNDDPTLLAGCRKEKGVHRFYDRTAGILALVRPCGVIVNTAEMYTCESPTQVYLFIIMTFARGRDIERLRYLGYDRACDLHPFLCNLERKGAYFAKWLIGRVKFLVDSFHVARHTEPCCMPPNQPQCKYHPTLERFKEVHGVNTECAEQSFRWLNRLKLSMKQMQQHKFNFFLHVITNSRNEHIEQTLRERKLL